VKQVNPTTYFTSAASPDQVSPEESLDDLRALVDDLARSARAPNTRRAYASSFEGFRRWSASHGLAPLPASPETVALYVGHLARNRLKVATVERALVAISQTHIDAGFASPRMSPLVRRVLRGLRRGRAGDQAHASPLSEPEIVSMVEQLPTDLRGLRDRAIVLLGFRSGLRRAELVALEIADLAFSDSHVVVRLVSSKTDQEGRGRKVVVARRDRSCAVAALETWIHSASLDHGALFRRILKGGVVTDGAVDGKNVDRIVKAAATAGGVTRRVSAHSLRSGFATDAARRGVDERTIMRTLGHRNAAMTRRYIDDAT
jgi:site-specific recombinase XerD